METFPLYATIETEYLDKLQTCKYIVDCITKGTINEKHLRIVCDSLLKAKTKHPHFADIFCENESQKKPFLEFIQNKNDTSASPTASSILIEEVMEAEVAFLDGDLNQCRYELGDVAAVVFRMFEFVDAEKKK